MTAWRVLLALFCLIFLDSVQASDLAKRVANMSLREKIGQRLMLDLTYWCANPVGKDSCQTPLTHLPQQLLSLLRNYHIGGIILFEQNIDHLAQTRNFTLTAQQVMQGQPGLLIAVDQEGGSVQRLPTYENQAFAGNLAISAAYLGGATTYAEQVGSAIAQQLRAYGINVNFAPDIDVNSNPDNPVINVRSFGEDPQLVARLGGRMLQAMQAQGIAATLKHFPGHGNTYNEGNMALPKVSYTMPQAQAIDLYPFRQILQHSQPDLIMTASMQYPALDASTIQADLSAERVIVPATFSRVMMHDILRQQLHYQGVAISDALHLGRIASHFSPLQATLLSWRAGNDVALMPIKISSPADLQVFRDYMQALQSRVLQDSQILHEMDASLVRIMLLKQRLGLLNPARNSHFKPLPNYTRLAQGLADDSVTLVQNEAQVLPLAASNDQQRVLIVMPHLQQSQALAKALSRYLPGLQIRHAAITQDSLEALESQVSQVDVVIAGMQNFALMQKNDQAPQTTPYQVVSSDGMSGNAYLQAVLAKAHELNKQTVYLSLAAPYDLAFYQHKSDVLLALYAGFSRAPVSAHPSPRVQQAFNAAGKVLVDPHQARGKLPLT